MYVARALTPPKFNSSPLKNAGRITNKPQPTIYSTPTLPEACITTRKRSGVGVVKRRSLKMTTVEAAAWNTKVAMRKMLGRNGGFLKWWYHQNTPKWSFLVGKPMVVGYHHLWKHPNGKGFKKYPTVVPPSPLPCWSSHFSRPMLISPWSRWNWSLGDSDEQNVRDSSCGNLFNVFFSACWGCRNCFQMVCWNVKGNSIIPKVVVPVEVLELHIVICQESGSKSGCQKSVCQNLPRRTPRVRIVAWKGCFSSTTWKLWPLLC